MRIGVTERAGCRPRRRNLRFMVIRVAPRVVYVADKLNLREAAVVFLHDLI